MIDPFDLCSCDAGLQVVSVRDTYKGGCQMQCRCEADVKKRHLP